MDISRFINCEGIPNVVIRSGGGKGVLHTPSLLLTACRAGAFGKHHALPDGAAYADYDDFTARGAGATVRFNGEIVASASSFLSYNGGIEVDLSTLPPHRGKGLASACTSLLLEQCREKRLVPHWDAQNETSKRIAEKFGFILNEEYRVTILAPLNKPA